MKWEKVASPRVAIESTTGERFWATARSSFTPNPAIALDVQLVAVAKRTGLGDVKEVHEIGAVEVQLERRQPLFGACRDNLLDKVKH